MKPRIPNLNSWHLLTLALLVTASTAIWFAGPYLYLFNQHILQSAEKRLYAIIFLILTHVMFFFLKPSKRNKSNNNSPESISKLEALQARFEGAIQFLRKTAITKRNKNINLIQLPWYLLIGPQESGKTTLLANSNINFTLTKQFKDSIKTSDTCDWWVTRELVLVDVPGSYLQEKNNYLWEAFQELVKKYSIAPKIKAIVITLHLPELIKQQNLQHKKQIVNDIRQKILDLTHYFGKQLPIQIVITKCDLLPGFTEYFSDCGAEELDQIWGIPIPELKPNENLIEAFTQRFSSLLKRLNSQLIWRLHQERNANSRPAIKDFPLQVERLRESLVSFLKTLAIKDLKLQGVYLTSAHQVHVESHLSQLQIINPASHQSLQLLQTPASLNKAYFIRQLVLQGFFHNETQKPIIIQKPWQRHTAIASSIAAVIFASLFLGKDFQQSVLQTYSIQNNLAQYQLSIQQGNQGENLLKALPLLNALQASTTRSSQLSGLPNLLSFYSDKSQKTAIQVYQKSLQTIVLPGIKSYLENYLKNSNRNPADVYAALKAYLMLGDRQKFQADYIVATFKKLSNSSLSPQILSGLNTHIKTAFNESPAVTLNNALIAQARTELSKLPNVEKAAVILSNSDSGAATTEALPNLENSLAFNNSPLQVAAIYRVNRFSSTYSEEIGHAANEALQGNWVLGTADVLANEAMIANLAQQLRTKYVSNYTKAWEAALNNLKIASAKDLNQLDLIITNLTSDTSPLLQILHTLKQQTAYEEIIAASANIQELNSLLENTASDEENTLYQIFVNLRQLHAYLQTMTNSNNIQSSAFDAAKARFQNASGDSISRLLDLADESPEPLKNWLTSIASQSWQLILQDAAHYVENAWQVNIFNMYKSQIANRYPFDESANEEVDLQQFANLVGKQGTFAGFYDRYLKPFIKEENKKWQWRIVDNQKMPFSNNVLEELQQAAKLQGLSKYALFTSRNNPAIHDFTLPENLIEKV